MSTKKKLHKYGGQIHKETAHGYEDKFAKKISDKSFEWPDKEDISEINKYQIIKKISPSIFKGSNRRIDNFTFI